MLLLQGLEHAMFNISIVCVAIYISKSSQSEKKVMPIDREVTIKGWDGRYRQPLYILKGCYGLGWTV